MSVETSHENYIQELIAEIEILDPVKSKYTIRLLGVELKRVQKKALKNELKSNREKQDFVKLTKKIMVPIDKYPCYNFIGKLMGPKATNIKRIQQQTNSSVLILGQGSTRDKSKEKMLAESGDPKFAHFKEPLHISIHVKGYKDDAESHLSSAITEVMKYMNPNDTTLKQEALPNVTTMRGPAPDAYGPAPPDIYSNKVTPIVRVGTSDSVLPSKKTATQSYEYSGTFDGTYEGYPTTGPTTTTKTNTDSAKQSSVAPPPIPPNPLQRNPLKRTLTPSSTSDSESEGGSPPPTRHVHKKPAMTVSNMFRRAYDSEEEEDDED